MLDRLSTLAIAAVGLVAGPLSAETSSEALLGTWQTPLAEMPAPGGGPSAYVRQTIVFEPTIETIKVEAFADAEARQLLFTYDSAGPWRAVGLAPEPAGALALDLENERSTVTAYVDSPDLWQGIGVADCPLVIGEAVDITDCVSGPPFEVADCVDRDIAMIDEEGTRLRMGGGDVNRCEVRPTVLSETAFFKLE